MSVPIFRCVCSADQQDTQRGKLTIILQKEWGGGKTGLSVCMCVNVCPREANNSVRNFDELWCAKIPRERKELMYAYCDVAFIIRVRVDLLLSLPSHSLARVHTRTHSSSLAQNKKGSLPKLLTYRLSDGIVQVEDAVVSTPHPAIVAANTSVSTPVSE